jgi:hypothetical protein
MEKEELEEIPWSSLVAHAEDGVDRRWYFVAGVVGVAIVAFLGLRVIAPSGGQPVPPQLAATAEVTTTTASGGSVSSPTLVVAEADLVGDVPALPLPVTARAEWFVTDFYTTDGSAETLASVRAALIPDLAGVELPHDADEPLSETFVEWARSYDVEDLGDGSYAVVVAFRTIAASVDGFVRLPVRAVSVVVVETDGAGAIGTLPVEVDLPS